MKNAALILLSGCIIANDTVINHHRILEVNKDASG